ncbi:MAG: hypothetical protein JF614_08675 [Acidobacteria bacterium]|nr:hypothetical protein [Acidobacteriota bacterium]
MGIMPANFVNLRSGRFDSTSRSDLRQLFDSFVQEGTKNLAVHFHGGLVSESSAMAMAERLLPEYHQTNVAYPVFFVWESGLLESIRNNVAEVANEQFFERLLLLALQFAGGKVLQAVGERGVMVTPVDDTHVEQETAKMKAGEAHWEEMTEDRRAATSDLTELEAQQLRDLLEGDPVFMGEVQLISNSVEPADQLARSRGAEVAGSRHTLMAPEVLADIRREKMAGTEGTRGIFGSTRLIKGAIVVVAKVVARFARKRDHGFHATVVEEIFREFYVSAVGREIWGLMKQDTADAFGDNTMLCGGSAFLEEIQRVDPDNKTRITLIGHSAGAEYVCNLLRNADRFLSKNYQFDIVLMAPACRIEFFADTVRHNASHIRNIRMFTMFDELEKKDRLIPILYPHSLLYFISGVLEDEADKPLLGMERYFISDAPAYQNPQTGIPDVRGFLSGPKQMVFSLNTGAPGSETNADSHGGFDDTEDPAKRATIDSIRFLLKNGWS